MTKNLKLRSTKEDLTVLCFGTKLFQSCYFIVASDQCQSGVYKL